MVDFAFLQNLVFKRATKILAYLQNYKLIEQKESLRKDEYIISLHSIIKFKEIGYFNKLELILLKTSTQPYEITELAKTYKLSATI